MASLLDTRRSGEGRKCVDERQRCRHDRSSAGICQAHEPSIYARTSAGFFAGLGGSGGNAPAGISAILDEDLPFHLLPGSGGGGGGGGGSTYVGYSLVGIDFSRDPGPSGSGGCGGCGCLGL